MTKRIAGIVAGLLVASLTMGHHSTANFDRSIRTEISGTVTKFQFSNPHSLIELDVVDEGQMRNYSVFATSKVVLLRYGWRPDSVKEGDSISITGHPDRDDPLFVYLTGIQFADGSEWSRSDILE